MGFVHELLARIWKDMDAVDQKTLDKVERTLEYPEAGEEPIFEASVQLRKILAYYILYRTELDRILNESGPYSEEHIMEMSAWEVKVDIAKALVKFLIDMESIGKADPSFQSLQVKKGWFVYGSMDDWNDTNDVFYFTRTTH